MQLRVILRVAGLALPIFALEGDAALGQTFSVTATFHNIGVEVVFPVVPTNGTAVRMFVKKAADPGEYREAHPLSRTSPTNFAGSVFGLADGTAYSIRLESTAFATNQYLSVSTRPDAFPTPSGPIYHVATTGNDANSGLSEADALRTLGAALAKASAGSTIWLHDGRYYEGDLSLPRSGTAAQPIVIRNAPGARPVLDGTDLEFAPIWAIHDAPNGVYRTACAATPANAYLNGAQFYRYARLSDLSTNRWNQPGGYYADGTWLYARFPGGVAPGTNLVMTIPKRTTGIEAVGVSNIQIVGIEFCYYGLGPYHRGIYIDGGDSNLIDRCFFHHVGIGVAFKRAACFNTVQRCLFTESPVATWSWHAVKDEDSGYESGGVSVYASDQPNVGNVIRHNVFTNLFDGSGVGSDNLAGPTRDLDFHDNLISGCRDDALEADGAGVNNRIYGNLFDDFLTGLSVAPCALGPTYVFRNVFSRWHAVEEYDGYPFKFNVVSELDIQWVHLYHNTCFTFVAGQNGFLFKNYSRWTNIVSRNNVFAGTSYALDSWSTVNPVDFDCDDLYTTHGTRFIRWAGTNYGTLEAFRAATGQEAHGCSCEPRFLDAGAGDYRLRGDSPLIDRGVAIPGINDAYIGTAPDIGAFEFAAMGTNAAAVGHAVETDWWVVTGGVYQAQYATNLVSPSWTGLGTVVTAQSRSLVVVDPTPDDPFRAYRLVGLGH